jgi:ribosomal protein S12 methylthiotransferase
MTTINLISLGCPKNTVDSENLIRALTEKGVRFTDAPEEADILAVNTCGFIEDAKRESIDEILRLAGLKANGKRLVVLGCLAQRYRDELREEMPEIDALFGVGEDEKIVEYCTGGETGLPQSDRPGNDTSIVAPHFKYLKVSEGCGRRCSFCVIPSIRGPHRSRRPGEILKEAETAVSEGAKELILIAQDITAYGKDMKNENGLAELVRDMASIGGDFWIRLLYLHPAGIDDSLLGAIAGEEKVVGYIDLPLQHSEDRLLKAMRRAGGTRKGYLRLIQRIRRAVPGVARRTSLIVGFPGEIEEEFNRLLDFVEEAQFDRLGAFVYSPEEGTPAAKMPGQVPDEVKHRRWEELMRVQAEISLEKNRELVGRTMRALVDIAANEEAVARIYSQAPEIDGHTVVKGSGLIEGQIVDMRITAAHEYDLEGEPV